MNRVLIICGVLILVLLVRYFIILSYAPLKKIAPLKDGTLCPDIFDLYEDTPYLSIPEKSYSAIPSSVKRQTPNGPVILSIRNDGVLDYRVNGVLVWSSDSPDAVKWSQDALSIFKLEFDVDSNAVVAHNDEFFLTLTPFAIHRKTYETYTKIWDLEGWESSFRPSVAHPTGFVFLMSENRHVQVALLSNGDLVSVEKTSLSTPPTVKSSVLQCYCD
jgi:hypothetical protein